jgi:transposase
METIVNHACGLDVHQASITACIMTEDIRKQINAFGTTTHEIERLKQWLLEYKITHVAMESTGVYWKPVFNIIGKDFELLLVNPQHIKNVPGRKTDVQDCEWICKLLQVGLLRASFIPKEDFRNLRDMTRYQKQLQRQIQNEKNRVHKLLQDANIKLTSVLSDIFGTAGTHVLNDLALGITDPIKLSKHFDFDKRLAAKKAQAQEALTGNLKHNHQIMLKKMLEYIQFVEVQIQDIEMQTTEIIKNYQKEYELLQTIPGVKEKGAKAILAEIGVDMKYFPDEKHLASWAGLCPGNYESAGIKKSSKITHGNVWLKTMIIECAWCAIRQKDHYLRSKYYKLVPRMGRKKALVAVGHKLLIACYHILKNKVEYKDLGVDYLIKNKEEKLLKHYIKKLTKLGYQARLQPIQVMA